MQRKSLFLYTAALFLILAATHSSAQAIYSARENVARLSVGAGFSMFSQDWGPGKVLGTTVWLDAHPPFMDGFLHDLSIELEGRDLSANRGITPANDVKAGQPARPRTDTFGGGLIYEPSRFHFRRIHPYAKGLISYGSIDFTINSPDYSHDTRTVPAVGAGADIRLT